MLLRVLFLIGLSFVAGISEAFAEWSVTANGNIFYTDDVALFSATRRSGIDGDPSQPVLDVTRTGLGSDMVFEPGFLISNSITTGLGRTVFSIKPQGFIFAVNPEWSQASVAVEALHSLPPTQQSDFVTLQPRINSLGIVKSVELNQRYLQMSG